MKKRALQYFTLTTLCLLTFTVSGNLWAAPGRFSFRWDPSPDSTVVGYNLYYGTASRTYSAVISVGAPTTYVVNSLIFIPGIQYYAAVTAYTAQGLESDYSGEAMALIPRPPINLGISPTNIAITSFQGANLLVESTKDLTQPFNQEATLIASADTINYPIDSSLGHKFYRVTYGATSMSLAASTSSKELQQPLVKKESRFAYEGPQLPPLPPPAVLHPIKAKRKMKIYEHGSQFLMSDRWR